MADPAPGSLDWLFGVFFGVVVLMMCLCVCVRDREPEARAEVLERVSPLRTVANIILSLVAWYIVFAFALLSTSVAAQTPFTWTQLIAASPEDWSFWTDRGLASAAAAAIAGLALAVALPAIVDGYDNMLDYCFTVFFFHFIVVSAVGGGFPVAGAWWASMGVCQFVAMVLSEYVAYRMDTMSYPSSLNGNDDFDVHGNEIVDLPALDPREEETSRKYTDAIDHVHGGRSDVRELEGRRSSLRESRSGNGSDTDSNPAASSSSSSGSSESHNSSSSSSSSSSGGDSDSDSSSAAPPPASSTRRRRRRQRRGD